MGGQTTSSTGEVGGGGMFSLCLGCGDLMADGGRRYRGGGEGEEGGGVWGGEGYGSECWGVRGWFENNKLDFDIPDLYRGRLSLGIPNDSHTPKYAP